MRAIDISIGHDDDPIIAQPFNIKLVADADPHPLDQGDDLGITQHPIQPGPLGIQHFTPQRQDRLSLRVAPRLG